MDIDLNIFDKLGKDSLIKHLSMVDGLKYIIADSDIIRIIDRVISLQEIKKFGVDKIFLFEDKLHEILKNTPAILIYIIRPEVSKMKIIAKHINDDLKQGPIKTKRRILCLPHKPFICEAILEQEGVFEYVVCDEIEINLIRLDTKMLCMEMADFFKNYYFYGDQSLFVSIAKSIITIESLFGTFLNIHLHGNISKSVYKLMNRLIEKSDESKNNESKKQVSPQFGHLILIDRSVDFVTPFCTPLNYEGLLDEIYSIKSGTIEIPNLELKRLNLSNDDPIFKNIRYEHISDVIAFLKAKIQNINELKETGTANIPAMKNFVQNDLKDTVKQKDLIGYHLKACESLISQKQDNIQNDLLNEHNILNGIDYKKSIEYIEELINRKGDFYQILRLMILISVTKGGISNSEFTSLTHQFLESFGFEKVFLLNKLQKLGLFEATSNLTAKEDIKPNLSELTSKLVQQFSRSNKSNNYENIKKKLNILPGDSSKLKSNDDISRLFNHSYRPIICKYIEQILLTDRTNPQKVKELEDIFPGEYECVARNASLRISQNRNEANKTVLIYFLGGCAYSELAALKLISKQKGYTFYYATTNFIGIKSVVNTLDEK